MKPWLIEQSQGCQWPSAQMATFGLENASGIF
jgi:hypothetical protein